MSKISLKHSGGNVVSLNSPTSAPTSADVAFKLPNADGSAGQFMKTDGSGNLAFATVAAGVDGITMADQWRVTSQFNSYNTVINSNWERQDSYSPGLIGSGMSESSGIFTFPSTGIYRIDFQCHAYRDFGIPIRYVGITIEVTTNNSNYNLVSNSYGSISNDDNAFAAMYCTTLFDVTDVSTHKVRFQVYSEHTVTWEGDTSNNRTSVIFTRLGDT